MIIKEANFLTTKTYNNFIKEDSVSKILSNFLESEKQYGKHFDPNLDLYPSQAWSRKFEYPWAIKSSMPLYEKRSLDIGTGYSVLPIKLSQCGPTVSLDMYEDFPPGKWYGIKNLEFIKNDIRKYTPLCNFDRIFCISVLEHIPDINLKDFINKILTWLNPNGRLMLTFDINVSANNNSRYQSLEISEVKNLMESLEHNDLTIPESGELLQSTHFGREGEIVGQGIGVFYVCIEKGDSDE